MTNKDEKFDLNRIDETDILRLMPREKLLEYGPEALSSAELLAIVLNTGLKELPVLKFAERFLAYGGGSLSSLIELEKSDLMNIKGFGQHKTAIMLALFEIAKRVYTEKTKANLESLSSVASASEYIATRLQNFTEEHFMVVVLNTKNKVLNHEVSQVRDGELHFENDFTKNSQLKVKYVDDEIISKGTVNQTIAMPREVFRSAIKHNASSIIIGHNHPSGDPTPSREDIELTRRMVECGRILGIELLDHIVVGQNRTYSLRQHGDM